MWTLARPDWRWLAAVVALALGGCAASQPGSPPLSGQQPGRAQIRAQGESWEAVLPGSELVEWRRDYPAWAYPEYARADVALARREPRLPTALDEWIDPAPILSYPRYLILPRQPDRVLFFPYRGSRR